jgi:tetratricopeptide (TPR) repeat protein
MSALHVLVALGLTGVVSASLSCAKPDFVVRAREAARAGRWEEASAYWTSYIRDHPKDPWGYTNRGAAYRLLARYDDAIADCSRSLEMKADEWVPHYFRGYAYVGKSDFQRALADFGVVVRMAPDSAQGYEGRGVAYLRLGNVELGLRDLGRSLELKPGQPMARHNMAAAYYELGRLADAARECSSALQDGASRSNQSTDYALTALKALCQGRYEEAVRYYGLLLEKAPSAVPYLSRRGDAYHGMGSDDLAKRDWRSAHALDPRYPTLTVAREMLGLGRDVSAVLDIPAEPVEGVDDPPTIRFKRPSGYALAVGLSSYQHAAAPSYSRRDAETFVRYAASVIGVDNAKLVCDEQATGSTIRANLTDWLKKKHGFKVIYFAGHGVPDPENPRNGGVCVLPYDGDPDLKSTLIPVSDLAELGANPDDTVVVFIDACFAGEGRTVQLASRPLTVSEIPETKAITFAAAEGSQPSKEFEKAQHGYFTYYTLLGLKGKADANNDGWVTTTELYNYVKKNVSDATNEVQVPVLRPAKDVRLGRIR